MRRDMLSGDQGRYLALSGSSTHQDGWTWVVLYDLDGTSISSSFKLEFSCFNNEADSLATVANLIPAVSINEQDWRTSIIQDLTQPSSTTPEKEMKDFTLINNELYFRGSGEVLARVVFEVEAKEEITMRPLSFVWRQQ